MASRYWIGGTGNWSSTNHWSAASGGSGGSSVPTSSDDVYFDSASFTASNQTCSLDVVAYCKNLTLTGMRAGTYINLNHTLYTYGNVVLFSGNVATVQYGNIGFESGGTQSLTCNGASLGTGIVLENDTTLNLLDDIGMDGSNDFAFYSGTLNTNNHNITMSYYSWFTTGGSGTKNINLGSSIITIASSNGPVWNLSASNVNLNAGTSKIVISGTAGYSDGAEFAGNGKTHYDVEFNSDFTMTGSNTFHNIKINAGKTLSLTAGTTQTVTTLSGDGVAGNLVTIQSVTAGTPFTINKSSGVVMRNYWSIKDCTVSGDATFIAIDSTNVSGNTGWTFLFSAAPTTQIWVRVDGVLRAVSSVTSRVSGA